MRPVEKSDAKSALMEEAAEWRLREEEGRLTLEELTALEAWRDASEEHRAAYARVDAAWNVVGEAASEPELVALRGAAFETARRAGRGRWARASLSNRARIFSIAAMVLIAVIASAAWVRFMPDTYATGVGERRVVALQDGSHISLDAATQVRVRLSGVRRELWLDHGRAKFDVARDPLRPFSVTAENRTVVATGTSFSVELLNDQVRVVLYEGNVSVLDRAHGADAAQPLPIERAPGGQSAHLTPGRELISLNDARPARIAPIDPVRSLSWEAGQLVFDNEPLSSATARMNRYTHSPMRLGDGVVSELRVSGVFRAGDTTAFVDGVTAVLPVRAENGPEGPVLRADPGRISR